MELSQLRAVVALRELASISKVADALHLTPPAVFSQIRHLEEQIGAKLYERVGKRLELTAHGKRLAERAKEIVRAHDETLAELQELRSESAAVLRIGCGPHSSVHILPHLLRVFLEAHPGTETRLATGSDEFLLHGVHSGMLDAILIHLPLDKVDLEEHPLYAYEMVFVASASSGIGKRRPIKLRDLAGLPYIRYHRPVLVDGVLEKLNYEAGFKPQTVIEDDNPASILELVKLGIGFAVLPYYTVARDVAARRLRIVRAKTQQAHLVGFAYRKPHHRRRILDDLIAAADQWPEWWPLAKYVSPVDSGS
ncbi:MAG: LysR family transcriptional regulator [bacterium]|nr:LysR family transcriptional regulator [bacterium]